MEISIVLIRPQFSGNLGSVARAMKNMGLRDLRLVEPEVTPRDREAKKMAAHAKDVLEGARSFWELPEALQGLDRVVGTSRRLGKDRPDMVAVRDFAGSLKNIPEGSRLGILFGTEDTGLTHEEIKLCHQLVYIPSHGDFPSLNLAQAVMVVCYEIFLARVGWSRVVTAGRSPNSVAKFEDKEGMVQDLQDLLQESGFLDPQNPEAIMAKLRQVFNRADLTEPELKIFRGIYRQIRWWAGQK